MKTTWKSSHDEVQMWMSGSRLGLLCFAPCSREIRCHDPYLGSRYIVPIKAHHPWRAFQAARATMEEGGSIAFSVQGAEVGGNR